MRIINKLLEYFQDKGEYIFPKEVLENALFFNTACLLGIYNIRLKRATNNGDKLIIPSYYGITFGSSGIGKNYSREITRQFFEPLFKRVVEACNDYMSMNYVDEKGKLDSCYMRLSNYYIPISSTEQGIQKQAQTFYAFGKGSVNIVNDEIGNFIQKSEAIFAKLKTAWDTGLSEGSVNASDESRNYFTIENMHYNMLLFGSPAPFEMFPNKKDMLLEAYLSGMARRCFIYHNDDYNKLENINKNFETMSKEDIEAIEGYRKELISFAKNTKYIIYPNEIRAKLVEFDMQKQKLISNSNNNIIEELYSYKKIEKLLTILAVLDLSEVVTEEHLEYAIDFANRCDETVYKTIEIKPLYKKIYEELLKRDYTARTDLIRAIKELNSKNIKDEMLLVEEYANLLGNTLIVKEYANIVKYKIEKMSKTSITDNIIISINTNISPKEPNGWIVKQGNFFNLHKIVCGNVRYSAGTFLQGYIKEDNYLKEQNLIILDIDEGMSIDEAKKLFSDMTYLIATTKSHQKEKNGLICDRFRIILPCLNTFHLDSETYKITYQNILDVLGLKADKSCKNVSRWYYGNPEGEYWYNEGELFDIRMFIPDSIENQISKKNIANSYKEIENLEYRLNQTYKWFLSQTAVGNRNNMIFRFGCMLKDKLNITDWESHIYKFNNMLTEPLVESEIINLIKSIQRR